ncbi:hypothetical protein KPATCC21470_6220 [Kitasatospora purpeofusca]
MAAASRGVDPSRTAPGAAAPGRDRERPVLVCARNPALS